MVMKEDKRTIKCPRVPFSYDHILINVSVSRELWDKAVSKKEDF